MAREGVDPEARWRRPWDGQWRMVLFDVAEQERSTRARLRYELRQHRLGCLQGSVWVSPDPLGHLRDTVKSMIANPEALLFFEGRPFAGESDTALVNGAWNFEQINEAYRAHLRMLATKPPSTAEPLRWQKWLARERLSWLDALRRDPLLPEGLLPAGYLGREAHRTRRATLKQASLRAFGISPVTNSRSPG